MTFKSIEIQKAFDNAVAKRLKREEYSDYEAPKSKAKRFDAEMKRLGEGSSPRVRGTLDLLEQHAVGVGIIPACAGNTWRPRRPSAP